MRPLALPVELTLIFVVMVAAATDIRSRNIPNWLTLGGIAAGFVLNGYSGGFDGLKFAGIGFGVACLFFLPIFFMRFMGGGDVKLMGAVGTLGGYENLIAIFIIDAILGGIVALVAVLLRGRLKKTARNIWRMIASMVKGKAPYQESEELEAGSEKSMGMPRAVTIALATLVVLWATRVPAP